MNNELKEYKIKIEKVQSPEKAVEEDYPENVGLRTKFGGAPIWIQEPADMKCPECGKQMTFIAELDSFEHMTKSNHNGIDPLSPDQEYMFGDVGMIYVFFCFDCLEVDTEFQCY